MKKPFMEESPTHHIGTTGALSRKAFLKRLHKNGLNITPEQLAILNILYTTDQIPMWNLALKLDRDNSVITRVVDNLQKAGYVKRIGNKTDRRIYNIAISQKGRKLVDIGTRIGVEYAKDATAGISAKDQEKLKSILVKIKSNIRLIIESS